MAVTRKFQSFMEKAEWVVPSLKVGDVAVVLHGYSPKEDDARFTDVTCGDTTVVDISSKGTITHKNGFKFHASGYGYANNSSMVISTRHAVNRRKDDTPTRDENGNVEPAKYDGHHSVFGV